MGFRWLHIFQEKYTILITKENLYLFCFQALGQNSFQGGLLENLVLIFAIKKILIKNIAHCSSV